jgi:hypothetical protein
MGFPSPSTLHRDNARGPGHQRRNRASTGDTRVIGRSTTSVRNESKNQQTQTLGLGLLKY